jgi:hypothetical protein
LRNFPDSLFERHLEVDIGIFVESLGFKKLCCGIVVRFGLNPQVLRARARAISRMRGELCLPTPFYDGALLPRTIRWPMYMVGPPFSTL